MDRAWMRQKLEQCLHIVVESEIQAKQSAADNDPLNFMRVRAEPTVLEIFRILDPDNRFLRTEEDFASQWTPVDRYNLERALGMVEDQEEWAIRLAPDSPALVASSFHSWVWASAQPFWQASLYRSAVHAAAVSITANTQRKVQRTDVFDDDLMHQVFSPDQPKPGKPRLRIPGDHNDKTIASRQRALMPFAQGCYAGLRNIAAHEHGPDWPQQRALQALASLSVLAGWIDECDVITDEGQSEP